MGHILYGRYPEGNAWDQFDGWNGQYLDSCISFSYVTQTKRQIPSIWTLNVIYFYSEHWILIGSLPHFKLKEQERIQLKVALSFVLRRGPFTEHAWGILLLVVVGDKMTDWQWMDNKRWTVALGPRTKVYVTFNLVNSRRQGHWRQCNVL